MGEFMQGFVDDEDLRASSRAKEFPPFLMITAGTVLDATLEGQVRGLAAVGYERPGSVPSRLFESGRVFILKDARGEDLARCVERRIEPPPDTERAATEVVDDAKPTPALYARGRDVFLYSAKYLVVRAESDAWTLIPNQIAPG